VLEFLAESVNDFNVGAIANPNKIKTTAIIIVNKNTCPL
jgi:hypothetical protein